MTSTVVEYFYNNGRLQYHAFSLNGEFHRTDGPAWEEWTEDGRLIYRAFWVNGKRHNKNGPASEWLDYKGRLAHREFWVNDEELSEEAFLAWQRQQRQRELAALVFALEQKFPADASEREFLRHILPAFVAGRHILPAHVAGEAPPCELNQ